jgi:hypothetical protein
MEQATCPGCGAPVLATINVPTFTLRLYQKPDGKTDVNDDELAKEAREYFPISKVWCSDDCGVRLCRVNGQLIGVEY